MTRPSTWRRLSYLARHDRRKLRAVGRLAWHTKLRSARRQVRPNGSSRRPPLVTINVNRACNLRCVQCWEWGEEGAYHQLPAAAFRDELSLAEWESLFDELAGWQPYLHFFGGEPLLRRDLPDLIAAATRRGMLTSVNTNMTLVDQAAAEALVAAGLDYVVASLDGPREVNDRIRLGEQSFDRTVAGVRQLLAARERAGSPFPIVEICCSVTQHNQAHLIETAEVADGLGVDHFKLQYQIFATPEQQRRTTERFERSFGVQPTFGEGFVVPLGAIDAQGLRDQEQELRRRTWSFQLGRRPRHSVKGFDPGRHFHEPDHVFGEGHCHNPWARAVLQPNGDLVVCQGFHDLVLGNVRDAPLMELWNGPAMRSFRASLTEEGLFGACARCCELYEMDES